MYHLHHNDYPLVPIHSCFISVQVQSNPVITTSDYMTPRL